MLTIITNFLITEWIWSITTGTAYLIINFFLLFALLKLWDHLRWLHAFLLSLCLTVGAFLIFFSIIGIILVWWLHVPYVLPDDAYKGTYNTLNSALILGGIYTLLQFLMARIIRHWKKLNIWRTFLCIACANLMTALLIYKITFKA